MVSIGFRVAPGVSLSASHKGLGASVGPRVARVHAGPGSAGISSGLGPLSISTSLSGKSRSQPRKASKPAKSEPNAIEVVQGTVAIVEMAAWGIGKWSTHRAKVADARARLEAEDQLRSAHLVDFPTATRTVLPEPHRAITHLLRGGREKHEEAHREWLVQQAEADAAWHRTINHDPLHIIGEINDVFSESAFPAVCVDAGTEDDKPYVTLVVTIPGHEVVIREPRQKGVPLHQRSDREIADIYNGVSPGEWWESAEASGQVRSVSFPFCGWAIA